MRPFGSFVTVAVTLMAAQMPALGSPKDCDDACIVELRREIRSVGDKAEVAVKLASSVRAELAAVQRNRLPIGTIVAYVGQGLPDGFLFADGKKLDKTDATFAPLCAALGNASVRTDDPVGTCRLPDLRGMFLRGNDNGANVDPARILGSRQSGSTARPVIPFQAGDSTHSHSIMLHYDAAYTPGNLDFQTGNSKTLSFGPSGYGRGETTQAVHSHAITGGDTETRPVNVSVNWLIKY